MRYDLKLIMPNGKVVDTYRLIADLIGDDAKFDEFNLAKFLDQRLLIAGLLATMERTAAARRPAVGSPRMVSPALIVSHLQSSAGK